MNRYLEYEIVDSNGAEQHDQHGMILLKFSHLPTVAAAVVQASKH
jgi:hypothetical protein